MTITRLSVHHFLVGLENADLLALFTLADELEADAVALAGGRVEQHHVRGVDRHLFLDDAAGGAGVRVALLVLLGDVDAFHHEVAVVEDARDLAAAALVLAGGDNDFVALLELVHVCLPLYSTSGASEMMRMKRSRSSRVTGPKIRVPIGSILLVSSTAALVSKRISDPS